MIPKRYDFQNRVYRSDLWSVEPGTGDVGHALVSQSWFDAAGNVIRSQGAGSRAFAKIHYDSLNREIHRYLAWNPGTSTPDNDVGLDTVVEQTDSHYGETGQLLWTSRRQRFEDAVGTGPLQGPTGAEPRARVSYAAAWYDGIGRQLASADYGTCGGAAFVRPSTVPPRSDLVLVGSNRYAVDGEPAASIDPMGTETRWENDALGRQIRLIENYRADVPGDGCEAPYDVNRTTEYRYNADGQLEYLILINPVTGDQVTQWVYGTTLEDSSVARADLLRAKIYPMADDEAGPELGDGDDGVYERIEYSYNRSGQVVRMKDPNGTIHDYDFNPLGQLLHDRATVLAAHIDGTVRRISLGYNERGQMETASSHSSALVGHGTVLNQVKREYDGFGQMVADWQEHGGAVTGSSPVVGYEFGGDALNNASRLVGMVYPNGRRLDYGYGASGGVDDHLSRLQSIGEDESTLVDYHFSGLARYLRIVYPEPGVELSYLTAPGAPDGGSGDPYGGYDRFGRVQQMRWIKTATGEIVDGWQWGFDRASNRTWRKHLVAVGGQDEAYGYDGLYQVVRDAAGTLNTNRTAIGGTPHEEEGFAYDPTGNWLAYRKDKDGASVLDQTRGSNRDNQLVQIDGSSDLLEYDKAGNALKVPPCVGGDWNKCFQPIWDAWNRLAEVKDENGATVQKNAYDGLFRRITKESGGVIVHTYWNSRWKPLEERVGSEITAVRSYVWGERPGHRDELVLRDRDTEGNETLDERLYVTMDYFSGTAVLDTSGNVVERYGYSSFGVRRIMAADFAVRSGSDYDWEFAYKGQFLDTETGCYNYGFRYYNPEAGRWLSRDPMGERGGINLYGFVFNSPANVHDRLGREPSPWNNNNGRCLRCAANDPAKPGEPHEPSLSDPKRGPHNRNTISCESMRKSLKARGAYEPSMSAGEGCECYRPDTGAYGYLSVFWVNKGDGGANDFQYHFYREGADGNFYDNDWTIGDRDALKGELKDYKAELGDSFTVCPAICFPEGGIDVD